MARYPFIRLLSGLLILLFLGAGCTHSREFSKTRDDLAKAIDVDFDRGVSVNMSPSLMRTAGLITSYIDEYEVQQVSAGLQGFRRVRFAVYPTDDFPEFEADQLDMSALSRFDERDWHEAFYIMDDDVLNWVMYRETRYGVRDIFSITLADDVLVLGRIQGDLDNFLDFMLEEVANEYGLGITG